jgi:hypothetical protein
MADTLRLRGDEVQLRLTQNGVLLRTLTAIKSFDVILKIEKKTEGFIGEGTMRHDMQFQGVAGTIVFQPESQEALQLAFAIRDRASRRVAQSAVHINAVFVAEFPNGDRPRMSVTDMQFGDIPFNVAGREQYVSMTFDFECDDVQLGI